jgi:LAO/AO transport system kinase
MKFSDEELVRRVLARDSRAVARLITRLESKATGARELAARLRRPKGRARIIGITGAPGAGKSTLVDQLASHYVEQGASVAILAVDPSSPFSGGALLGDRIRMDRSANNPAVFIRSMATRGALGGLSRATLESVHVLDSAGFDVVLVETVGVGQAEVDIIRAADTCVVVLVPGMGDSVQIIKAGLMEIADLFLINKADRDGALSLEKDLLTLLSLGDSLPGSWNPRIIKTIATTGEGVPAAITAIADHGVWLDTSVQGADRRLRVVRENLIALSAEWLTQRMVESAGPLIDSLAVRCLSREISHLEGAELVLQQVAASFSAQGPA